MSLAPWHYLLSHPVLGGAGGRAGAGLAMMADDGDGQLRTEGSDGLGAAGAEEETAAGEGWVAGGEMLLSVGLLALALLAAYGLYVRWGRRSGPGAAAQQNQAAAVPRMKRRDFTLEQLREFDGARKPNILLAVNGKVFDVTNGSKFYGPGERLARPPAAARRAPEGRGRGEPAAPHRRPTVCVCVCTHAHTCYLFLCAYLARYANN